jgi:hypothetical protein
MVVAEFAPVRQTAPNFSKPPKIFRPRTLGREYTISMSVRPTRCFTTAVGLG